jgi:hypothetical protein
MDGFFAPENVNAIFACPRRRLRGRRKTALGFYALAFAFSWSGFARRVLTSQPQLSLSARRF